MPKPGFDSVDDYIASHTPETRRVLERVRNVIRTALPKATESISYQMPTYKLHGATVLHLAGWKEHYALYGATPEVLAAFRDELALYEVIKGTIRFPLSAPVPVRLIERIVRFRASKLGIDTEVKSKRPTGGKS